MRFSCQLVFVVGLLIMSGVWLSCAATDDGDTGPVALREEGEGGARFVQVADGIVVALRPREARFDDGNSGLVAGSDGWLVVDAPMDSRVGEEWIARASDGGGSLRWVVNTHWHGDHVQGNAQLQDAFPAVTLIGHHSVAEDMADRTAADHNARVERLTDQVPEALAALEQGKGLSGQELTAEQLEAQREAIEQAQAWLEANRDVRFVAPTDTFDDERVLDLGGVTVRLLHFEAHTRGDTVVVVPERRLAFTGDLLDELPFVGHGSPRSWIEALDQLEQMPIDQFVPGHGDPFGIEHLRTIRSFLQAAVEVTDQAKESGANLEETIASELLAEWCDQLCPDDAARRFFGATVGQAIEAAWNETESSNQPSP